ncbi:MAG: ABC transporter ATP-binding protein [Burkholderiales bacterium 66-5]|nr:MAG: ABC transporter ATP-binding protein [Burkholderiales bacterium 66-5]
MTGGVQPVLRVRHLSHAFGPREVLQRVSLELPAGHTLALVGPSGSGKSTLLNLCAGLLTVREGKIENGFARTVVLFQQPSLLPWKTVRDNIALGLKAAGISRSERLQRSRAMGHAMGLDDLALAQFPTQLSGGMQSRAALARALVLEPDLLLLDEPFSALDIGLRDQMHRLLLAEQARRPLAVLMITHDLMEAVALADSVLLLAGRPARLCWRLDLPLPAAERSDDWIHRQTALVLAQSTVREAFELPALEDCMPPARDAGLSAGVTLQAGTPAASERCEVLL